MRKNKKWNYELLHKTALMYETRYEFQKGSPNAYRASLRRGILDDICSHMEYVRTYWTDEMLREEALKYKTRNEFKKGSVSAYVLSQSRGILDNICSHMENIFTYWTDEMLREEAKKYKTRKEFQKGSNSAYQTCRKRGILNDVCSHMEPVLTYWTDEMLRDEALKYKTRGEFSKGSESAYVACRSRGILDDVCSHMEDLPHWDKLHCVYLIEIFTTSNELYYYVGQTCNLKDRLNKHFCNNKSSDSPVFEFLNKTPIKYKKHYIVKNNLTYKESLELERDTIKDLKDRGIKLLNKELYIYKKGDKINE